MRNLLTWLKIGVTLFMMSIYLISNAATLTSASTQQPANILELRHIAKMKRDVTFLGLGALEIGRDWGIGTGEDRQHPAAIVAKQVIDTALQQGINVIDTASAYHRSEERVGEFAAPYHNRIMLNTKAGEHSIKANDLRCKRTSYDHVYCENPASYYDFSHDAIVKSVDESLKKLKTDHIDILFLHFGDDAKAVLAKGEAVATLKALKKSGKIRYMGASTDGDLAKRCIESGDFDAIELEYNLLNQTNKANIALAHEKGMGVFVRGGLGTGLLTAQVKPYLNDPNLPYAKQIKALLKLTDGNYDKLTQLALAFLYENKNISSVIIGFSQPDYITQDIQLINSFNDPALLAQAEQLLEKYSAGPYTVTIDAYFAKKLNHT